MSNNVIAKSSLSWLSVIPDILEEVDCLVVNYM